MLCKKILKGNIKTAFIEHIHKNIETRVLIHVENSIIKSSFWIFY